MGINRKVCVSVAILLVLSFVQLLTVCVSWDALDVKQHLHKLSKQTNNYEPSVSNAKTGTDFASLLEPPVVIFSRTTCPYSRRAKHLLLETLDIVPKPVVIETDEHEHTDELRKWLESISGIATVPNIFVYGQSIGGFTDVDALHSSQALESVFDRLSHGDVVIVKE
ncbi:monothiol glutaredoxin Grx3 [Schizosaccharomyces japonicus yFS275]|uniref:Monothiol glutaredoxin Grx3 n=1 Tax=Schizosaccharomyces japonicus (strain yFS275 / FY16936) TaxID=402676 RepID=B6K2M8_SCHJY|nr:monothiol glutaredoxin Grx3 [Schizosaccharomyces japonicus yFS275]EEB07409.1 monothiol glutaredoxin Grx3 [Schizosaccharomyces japonicus yFS275]